MTVISPTAVLSVVTICALGCGSDDVTPPVETADTIVTDGIVVDGLVGDTGPMKTDAGSTTEMDAGAKHPDLGPLELCIPAPPDDPLPNDFDITAGQLTGDVFTPLKEGAQVEIVQGPQGGVHVEVALRFWLPAEYDENPVWTITEGVSIQPCGTADQAEVGSFYDKKYPVFRIGAADSYQTATLFVIFDQNEAIHYQDKPCAVRLTVAVKTPGDPDTIALRGSVTVPLICVDHES